MMILLLLFLQKQSLEASRRRETTSRSVLCDYYCSTYEKAVRVGEGDSGGHVQRETTSRGLCGLVCPSRTSERGGEGSVCVCLLLHFNIFENSGMVINLFFRVSFSLNFN